MLRNKQHELVLWFLFTSPLILAYFLVAHVREGSWPLLQKTVPLCLSCWPGLKTISENNNGGRDGQRSKGHSLGLRRKASSGVNIFPGTESFVSMDVILLG